MYSLQIETPKGVTLWRDAFGKVKTFAQAVQARRAQSHLQHSYNALNKSTRIWLVDGTTPKDRERYHAIWLSLAGRARRYGSKELAREYLALAKAVRNRAPVDAPSQIEKLMA